MCVGGLVFLFVFCFGGGCLGSVFGGFFLLWRVKKIIIIIIIYLFIFVILVVNVLSCISKKIYLNSVLHSRFYFQTNDLADETTPRVIWVSRAICVTVRTFVHFIYNSC